MDNNDISGGLAKSQGVVFHSIIEEVCAGTMHGATLGGMAVLLLGGIVGRLGEKAGEQIGVSGTVTGCLTIWCLFGCLPLFLVRSVGRWYDRLVVLSAGGLYLWALHFWIGGRDIGRFYPWILSALPFGISLGTFYEPIRLARGGETESYRDAPGFAREIYSYRGNHLREIALFVAALVSIINRNRLGAMLGGALCGGLVAFGVCAFVVWRGDNNVAQLFFGSLWTIAYAGTSVGVIAGGSSGLIAWSIRNQQEQRLAKALESDR